MNNKIRITGLWKEKGTSGDYLSGTLGSFKILIFPVQNPKPTGPHFELYLSAVEKQQTTVQSTGFPGGEL